MGERRWPLQPQLAAQRVPLSKLLLVLIAIVWPLVAMVRMLWVTLRIWGAASLATAS